VWVWVFISVCVRVLGVCSPGSLPRRLCFSFGEFLGVWSGCKRDTVISPLVVLGGVGIGLSPFRLPNE